ncbi:MAG: DUF86 domain-containing protein [Chloroflexi bacterium]|jgi:uncharacterized protein with HEPN domain|nr:DUF86 domain-containing protein [Chloroflexota bacterium]
MKPTLKKRLLDALEACRAIQGFVAGRSFADYERNLMLRSAVERQFEIIGEALSHAEIEQAELTTLIPDLRRIVGLRNRIIHGYDSVDDQLLWQTVHAHLPPLAHQLEQLLASE